MDNKEKAKKLRARTAEKVAELQRKKTAALIEKTVDGKKEQFVEVTEEDGKKSLFETIKKGARTFVKVAGIAMALNTFMITMGCTTVPNTSLNYLDLTDPASREKVAQGAVPGSGAFSSGRTSEQAATVRGNEKAIRKVTVNDLNDERNTIAADATGLADRIMQMRRSMSYAQEQRAAGIIEYLYAIADTETGSRNNTAGTGYERTINQFIEKLKGHYRETKTPQNFVDGGEYLNKHLVETYFIEDVRDTQTAAVLKSFEDDLKAMRDYAANPTNRGNATANRVAIRNNAELIAKIYDIDRDMTTDLFKVIGEVWVINGKVIILENANEISTNYRKTAAPRPAEVTRSGGGSGGSSLNNDGGSGTGPEQSPPSGDPGGGGTEQGQGGSGASGTGLGRSD